MKVEAKEVMKVDLVQRTLCLPLRLTIHFLILIYYHRVCYAGMAQSYKSYSKQLKSVDTKLWR